jgi:hypothetical protein
VEQRQPGHDLLQQALRDLADEEARLTASPAVDARLRAEVRKLVRASRPRWTTSVAAAAAVVIFVAVWRLVPSEPARPPRPAARIGVTGTGDFLPLPYAHVPTSGGHIIRMTVPRESLASFGFDPGNPGAADAVLADVFVGDDGIARAVHFIGPDTREEIQR